MIFVLDAGATMVAVLSCLVLVATMWEHNAHRIPFVLVLLLAVFWLAGRHWWGHP